MVVTIFKPLPQFHQVVILLANSKASLILSANPVHCKHEKRIRQHYAMRRRRTTVHEKVLYSRERGNVRDRLDSRAASRTTNMIEDAAQAPLSVAR